MTAWSLCSSARGRFNDGTGPATIRFFDAVWNDIHFPSLHEAYVEVRRTGRAVPTDAYVISSYTADRTLRPGEVMRPVFTKGRGVHELCERVLEANVQVTIVYESIYGECWQLSDEGTRQLTSCPRSS